MTRGVRCPTHGLIYDPKKADGCVLCRRQRQANDNSQVILVVLLAAVVAVAVVAVLVGLRDQAGTDEEPSQRVTRTAAVSPIRKPRVAAPLEAQSPQIEKADPERYRDQITRLEKVLFAPGALDQPAMAKVVLSARRLSRDIQRWEDPLTAPDHAAGINAWAAALDSESDAGYVMASSVDARLTWQTLRARIFLPAPWFRHYGDESPPSRVDPQTVAALSDLLTRLKTLTARGKSDSAELGKISEEEPVSSEGSREWARWSRQWLDELNELANRFPARPSDQNTKLVFAHRKLEEALANLRAVTVTLNDTSIPYEYERKSRLQVADRELSEAESFLRMLRSGS
jgi:hypothetical protein